MLQKKIDKLPEWDLSDLYDAPESITFNADMEQLKKSVHDFEAEYKKAILIKDAPIDENVKRLKKSIVSKDKVPQSTVKISLTPLSINSLAAKQTTGIPLLSFK